MRRGRPLGRPGVTLAGLAAIALTAAALTAIAVAAPPGAAHRPSLPAHPSWYWQLQGRLRVPAHVAIVDVDGFDTSAAEVARLNRRGQRTVCYIDVGTWVKWRPDAGAFPRSLLGAPDGWPGERWLDIRALSRLEPIMTRRLRMCAAKGFSVVEPDNLDPLGNRTGFALTRAEVLGYAGWVGHEAHRLGLAVLQKNGPELARALEPLFDGALVEQCHQYAECGAFRPYLAAGKPVLDAEYAARLYPGFCTEDRRLGLSGALYDLALDGRRYRPCPL